MNLINKFLTGLLCPRVKNQIQPIYVSYQWILVISLVLFVSCQALAQEVKVQQMPLAATVSKTDFKENDALLRSSSEEEQDTTLQEKITPLKIGDKIPDELWEMYFPVVSTSSENEQYLSLGDFKDKLIILDFWATWCGSCISSLHKLDSLQKEFEGDLVVVPTSYEPKEKVQPFFANKGWSLPTAYEETYLRQYFPHRVVPHQVWIKNKVVIGIGGSEYAKKSNIINALEGKVVRMLADTKDLTITNENFVENLFGVLPIKSSYTRVLLPWIDAAISGSHSSSTKYMVFNSSIPHLYHMAHITEIPFSQKKHRVLLEVSSENERLMNPMINTGDYDIDFEIKETQKKAYFSYILEVPDSLSLKDRSLMMRDDLNKFFNSQFGITAQLEERDILCYSLKLISEEKLVAKSKKQQKPTNDESVFNIDGLVKRLRFMNRHGEHYIVNNTDYEHDTNIVLPKSLKDINLVNIVLKEYGMEFIEEHKPVEVLVIKEL